MLSKNFNPRSVDTRLLEAIDLAPTMLAIAGRDKPTAMQGAPFLEASKRRATDAEKGSRL